MDLLNRIRKGSKLKNAHLDLTAEEKSGYLHVTLDGVYSLAEAKNIFVRILDILEEKQIPKLLLDVSKLNGTPSKIEIYEMGKFGAEQGFNFTKKGIHPIKIAYYGKEPFIDHNRFGQTVGNNRGLDLLVTTEIDEALRFLGV